MEDLQPPSDYTIVADLGKNPEKVKLPLEKDITAALVPGGELASAQVICREPAIFCGRLWANETARQVDKRLQLHWQVEDGASVEKNAVLVLIEGSAKSILTMERTMLNFVQLLSGTATRAGFYASLIAHTQATILDTRKTVPGLRHAQKYAVKCGGAQNHRMGLYDAFLIKENHIQAAGGIAQVIAAAKKLAPDLPIEIEVEETEQLVTAIESGADIVMLDNFSLSKLKTAVSLNQGNVKLEASGGITEHSIVQIAETGVDYISIGELTKNIMPLDLSLLFT
ncbi:MAG: carboxylating nicotinate-nucleotide diphosphorylase [Pseudomonadales bacterium]|nr:carboxylating nicotinate-nucleotide diphosphorylase [Pseudomonadales bacterium]